MISSTVTFTPRASAAEPLSTAVWNAVARELRSVLDWNPSAESSVALVSLSVLALELLDVELLDVTSVVTLLLSARTDSSSAVDSSVIWTTTCSVELEALSALVSRLPSICTDTILMRDASMFRKAAKFATNESPAKLLVVTDRVSCTTCSMRSKMEPPPSEALRPLYVPPLRMI